MDQVQDEMTLESDENSLKSRITLLENEKKKIREEFDSQRAKMKDLFLQKEDELHRKSEENSKIMKEIQSLKSELDDVKSQLCVAKLELESNYEIEKRKADEEIATLQQLVHETVEESSCSKTIYDTEVQKLHKLIEYLENENKELRNELLQSPYQAAQESSSLAPSVVLSAVTKKLAKKLGADAFTTQDSDDSMNKAQEDVELLKSLLTPLEEEIKALKTKLRATDEQLQKCRQCGHLLEQEAQMARAVNESNQQISKVENKQSFQSMATNTSFDAMKQSACDMCSNYEAQLVKEQQRAADLQVKIISLEKASERHREDLLKEIGFRKDMEEKWNEKKEEHKQQVAELTRRTECAELDLKELQQIFRQNCNEVKESLAMLKSERERVQLEIEKIQKENDNLVGKYSVHSQQLQSEIINLPDTVEELHELILKSHQELIFAKIGKEAAEEKANTLRSDIMLLKDQITNDQQMKESLENNLVAEIDLLKKQKYQVEKEKESLMKNTERLNITIKKLEENLSKAQSDLNEANLIKKHLEDQNSELKTRVASLQQELDTSETVQKDFVRLSQSLQVQLEKIRASDTQVRWQHDEDVEECPTCRSSFSVTKRKQHCRHCGQIFCIGCLAHTVLSGPNQRPSKVCDVCHTLLVKSSAPYFSTEAPHSPD